MSLCGWYQSCSLAFYDRPTNTLSSNIGLFHIRWPQTKEEKKHEKLKNKQTITKRKNQSSGKQKNNLLPLGPAFSGDVFKVLCSGRAWAWLDRGYPCGQEAVLIWVSSFSTGFDRCICGARPISLVVLVIFLGSCGCIRVVQLAGKTAPTLLRIRQDSSALLTSKNSDVSFSSANWD